MPGPNFVLDKGFKVNAALATPFLVVKTTTTKEVCAPAVATDRPLGVAQEDCTAADVTAGRVIDIRMLGISRVKTGGTVAIGDAVKPTAASVVITTTTANDVILGYAMTGGVSGDYIDVFLTPGAKY